MFDTHSEYRDPIRIGLVGAGAISQQSYLPVLERVPGIILTSIVDIDPEVLDDLAKRFSLEYLGPDLNQCLAHIDAAIVATPNHLHFPLCKTLLAAGKDVLCEKPITTTSDQCRQLIDLADACSLKLAVSHARRFYRATQRIKQIIDGHELGSLISFELIEGTIFSWPTVSGFIFDREQSGGGVLIDMGVHLLDLLLWWCPREIVHLNYQDDCLGGVEAYSKIEIGFSDGIKGTVKISRISVLRNLYTLHFEKGSVEWNPYYPKTLYLLRGHDRPIRLITPRKEDPMRSLISDFIHAIQHDHEPFIPAQDTLNVIQLIERCYQTREKLSLEWLDK